LRTRPSGIPVAKFTLARRDRRAVVFGYGSLVRSFKPANCPLDRGEPFSCQTCSNVSLPNATSRQ
jgi:hypothetical protein